MSAFRRNLTRVWTAARLGPVNVARVLVYRGALRMRVHPVQYQRAVLPRGAFFAGGDGRPAPDRLAGSVPSRVRWFGWIDYPLQASPPDWHTHIVTGTRFPDPMRSWWMLPDFSDEVGDIKGIWEPSRFDWVLGFAQRYRAGDERALDHLNRWLADWCDANPAYLGPNWKCGQEASIRVMHLVMAACILEEAGTPSAALLELLEAHLDRIAPTLSYAVSQDNNHGTSEAAALFMAGTLCAAHERPHAERRAGLGRRWLEERVARLIATDGSFSQYSVNYHRVLLDTLSMAELWRRRRGLPAFSGRFYDRARAAARWLELIVEPSSGDAPNVGANDGARLLPLAATDYRDYRPSVQLAAALFAARRAYATRGTYDEPLAWLGLEVPRSVSQDPESTQCDAGGHAILIREGWRTLVRYPRYRFRPRHCDALHLDVWHDGVNVARDGGSFSYNAEAEWRRYFTGTASHNTVQFDGRDQMPELGRFLRGAWLRARGVGPLKVTDAEAGFAAGYRDYAGASHYRHVSLRASGLVVTDRVSGFTERAVLRWRLCPCEWSLVEDEIRSGSFALKVSADVPVARRELVDGWESRYYHQRTAVPVLEVEVHEPGTLVSEIESRKVRGAG